MICTFFGHRDAPAEVEDILKGVLIDLTKNNNISLFYVGNQGGFDSIVKRVLEGLGVKYYVVLAYMPGKIDPICPIDYSKTIYPEGLENTPPKFAITKRNNWMIEKSDLVITYVTKSFGGAYNFKQKAIKKGKTVVEISEAIM